MKRTYLSVDWQDWKLMYRHLRRHGRARFEAYVTSRRLCG